MSWKEPVLVQGKQQPCLDRTAGLFIRRLLEKINLPCRRHHNSVSEMINSGPHSGVILLSDVIIPINNLLSLLLIHMVYVCTELGTEL